MVHLEIDGIQVEVPTGTMVIEAADQVGIKVPRFCYHKKLSVAANCRMCLVEVEKAPKPMPSCATPVTEGMVVHTKSHKAISAQKAVMEFLLINHPLDCPICDQGGECELQDVAVGYGQDFSKYREEKRVVPDPDLGALISTDMTRCIHCTRCVRFGAEMAGMREMGATGRGEFIRIGTYVEKTVDSELSGNVIDLCPVGALTSKPFRYAARAWELRQYPSIAPHDALGSNINVHVRGNTILRVVPRENDALNEMWLSDRDRFSYEGLYSDDRLTTPMVKVDGQWCETSWDEALQVAAKGLKDVVSQDVDQLGALSSPNATCEEMYLLQKLVRAVGSANVDHRLRQSDFSDQDLAPRFPYLGLSVDDLEQLDSVLIIGSNLRKEQPLINLRIRMAVLGGAQVAVVNPIDFDSNYPLTAKIIAAPQSMAAELAGVAQAIAEASGKALPAELQSLAQGISPNDSQRAIAKAMVDGENGVVLLGNLANAHPALSALRGLAAYIAQAAGAKLGYLPEAANSAGGWLSGAVPHRLPNGQAADKMGLDASQMVSSGRKAYLLVGLDPQHDMWDGAVAQKALADAEVTVALTSFRSASLDACADVLLPIGAFGESGGTYVNAQGDWQSFNGIVRPMGESRPAWKVLRVLGNLLDAAGFDFNDLDEVREELDGQAGEIAADNALQLRAPTTTLGGQLTRVGEVAIYGCDPLVRRATSLQKTQDADVGQIRISAAEAGRLGLTAGDQVKAVQGGGAVVMPLSIDERVPAGAVWLAAGLDATAGLGPNVGEIGLEKA